MFSTQKRHAFTMIELLLVIVILGIVGGFALEAIRQYYEGIFRNGEYTKRVATADHVLEQMSKYFENAISSSIVNLDRGNTTACYGPPVANDSQDYTIAFVGVDHDSLRGTWDAAASTYLPGWNEDVNVSGATMTQTGANYTYANTIITALFPASNLVNSAIYNNGQSAANSGTCNDFNWSQTAVSTKYLPIVGATATTITTDRNLSDENKKRAYLLRSGYAFRVLDNGDLTLYSNYRPWIGERYNTDATAHVLAQNVAHIYADYDAQDFQSNPGLSDRGMVWRLKVCMRGIDQDLSESNASSNDICREKRVHVRY